MTECTTVLRSCLSWQNMFACGTAKPKLEWCHTEAQALWHSHRLVGSIGSLVGCEAHGGGRAVQQSLPLQQDAAKLLC